jgi:putative tryptophan/tyrosine transport system substrate-binding protein
MIERRTFIAGLGAAAAWPLIARGQQSRRTYRIGVVSGAPRADGTSNAQFFDQLSELGFVESKNLIVDNRGFGKPVEQYAQIARDMVASGADALFCPAGDAAVRAAQGATQIVPIVGMADDMVASGLVASLPRPGGNTTGISILAPELDGKRQEILMEVFPGARRIAALADPAITTERQLASLREAARARGGVEFLIHPAGTPEEIAPAIAAAKDAGADALNVLATPLFSNHASIVIERAGALRMPAIYQWPHMTEDGGLIAYGPRREQLYRQLAVMMAKVLRGASAAEIPVEQPTKFELVVNLRTAKAIGLAIPESFLVRADKVIE